MYRYTSQPPLRNNFQDHWRLSEQFFESQDAFWMPQQALWRGFLEGFLKRVKQTQTLYFNFYQTVWIDIIEFVFIWWHNPFKRQTCWPVAGSRRRGAPGDTPAGWGSCPSHSPAHQVHMVHPTVFRMLTNKRMEKTEKRSKSEYWMRSSLVWLRYCRAVMISSRVVDEIKPSCGWDLAEWLDASGFRCQSRTSHGFNPSIL